MKNINARRTGAAIAVAALVAILSAACTEPAAQEPVGVEQEDEDCDAEDLRNREAECGYIDPNGAFVLYPWIVPGVGGHPPKEVLDPEGLAWLNPGVHWCGPPPRRASRTPAVRRRPATPVERPATPVVPESAQAALW